MGIVHVTHFISGTVTSNHQALGKWQTTFVGQLRKWVVLSKESDNWEEPKNSLIAAVTGRMLMICCGVKASLSCTDIRSRTFRSISPWKSKTHFGWQAIHQRHSTVSRWSISSTRPIPFCKVRNSSFLPRCQLESQLHLVRWVSISDDGDNIGLDLSERWQLWIFAIYWLCQTAASFWMVVILFKTTSNCSEMLPTTSSWQYQPLQGFPSASTNGSAIVWFNKRFWYWVFVDLVWPTGAKS